MLWWLLLVLAFLATQYVHKFATKQSVNHVRVFFNTIISIGCAFIAANLFLGAFYMSNYTWGTPVNIQQMDDGVTQVLDSLEALETSIQQREAELAKLRQQITGLLAWERILHNRLHGKLIEIQQTSRLDPVLLRRIGPAANLPFLDFSRTYDALVQIGALEATVKQNILEGLMEREEAAPVLSTLKELSDNLNTVRGYKVELLEKLAAITETAFQPVQHDEEELRPLPNFEENQPPIPPLPGSEEPLPTEPVPAEPPSYEPLPIPSHEQAPAVEPLPVPEAPQPQLDAAPAPSINLYVHSFSIPDSEGRLLWSGHKLVTDVKETQVQLAKAALTTVQLLKELMYYKQAVKADEGSAFYRVSASNVPVTFLFMDQRAKASVQPGDPIFACHLGPLWCHQVGVVKVLYNQPQRAPHPFTGEVVRGFLAEAELTEPAAAQTRVLHVHRPFFN